ncbi:MAG: DUF1349 domain-containing protein [Anaerolineaceae bacterium]|nr:DUF1349 domain-containing protein [Anaerolineaceae bacterium]
MNRVEPFLGPSMPAGFYWFNPPAHYQFGDGLELYTGPQTDFWQRTHYGFERDDGHCLLTKLAGDFAVTTQVEFRPKAQYDQCGLIVRVDSQNWVKTSTEYESAHESRLGSVVTNLGYSDWATQTISSEQTVMSYRISKRGRDFLIESALAGEPWQQLRVAHLHQLTEPVEVGVYACSPIGQNFWCRFARLEMSDNPWFYAAESSL